MPEVPEAMSRLVPTRSILWSIVLMVLGFVAIASPIASSIGAALVIGWLVFISGLVQLVHAFQSKGIGHIVWKLLVAAFYLVAGVYMIAHPASGIGRADSRARHIFLRGRRRGYHRLVLDSKERRFRVDATQWNRHPVSGLHDLESMARHFVMVPRNPGGHQPVHGWNGSADDGPGGSQAPERSREQSVPRTPGGIACRIGAGK